MRPELLHLSALKKIEEKSGQLHSQQILDLSRSLELENRVAPRSRLNKLYELEDRYVVDRRSCNVAGVFRIGFEGAVLAQHSNLDEGKDNEARAQCVFQLQAADRDGSLGFVVLGVQDFYS